MQSYLLISANFAMKTRRKQQPKITTADGLRSAGQYWAWLLMFATIAFVTTVRLRLLQTPLERDEGEYAYAGWLMLNGIPPYVRAYNMKLPGIYAAYALIMAIFGQTHVGVRIGLLIVNVLTVILVFLLARRLFDVRIGVMAAAGFAVMSLNHYVLGMFAHATHFVTIAAVAGLLLFLEALESGKQKLFFSAGLCLGIAFLMKQPGIFFGLFAALYLLVAYIRCGSYTLTSVVRYESSLFGGMSVPLVLTCLILWLTGAFQKFWFWTVKYGAVYATEAGFATGFLLLRDALAKLLHAMPAFWLLALIGIATLFISREYKGKAWFVIGFFVFSFLATCPAMYFRGHYFIVMLPSVAILAAVGVNGIGLFLDRSVRYERTKRIVPAVVFLVSVVLSIAQESSYMFFLEPAQLCKRIYGIAPFAESLVIGKYIRQHSRESDTIAVLGSEPQIYFYAKRQSATGYIYMYPLMGKHKYAALMQDELIHEVESARPKYVVFVNMRSSWMRTSRSPARLWNWLQGYCLGEYDPVGCVQMISDEDSIFIWGEDLDTFTPQPEDWVLIMRRKR